MREVGAIVDSHIKEMCQTADSAVRRRTTTPRAARAIGTFGSGPGRGGRSRLPAPMGRFAPMAVLIAFVTSPARVTRGGSARVFGPDGCARRPPVQ
jgi:hypothetical protein